MRFTAARWILFGITLVLFGPIASFSEGLDAKARAREVLNQARAALGGDAALNAVRSLSGLGDFRSGSAGTEVSGEVQLDLLLPDKFMRTMKWSPMQTTKVTRVEAMDGDHVWTDSQMKQPSEIMGGGPTGNGGMGGGGGRTVGGMGRSGGGHHSTGGGGGSGKQSSVDEPVPELGESTDSQQMRLDFSCMIIALFLHSPDLSQTEFSYVGDGDIDGAKADFLKIVTRDGLEISLAVDQKSHRPITAAYRSSTMNTDRRGRPRLKDKPEKDQDSEPQIAETQIYFSEYRALAEKGFDDIWLPYQITKARNGQIVEDMHIKKFQLNPHLKPKQFEKKG
jgi:hypothetical protein